MISNDLDQLDLLARVDDLTARVRAWVDADLPWEPAGRVKALLRRVLDRVETLRVRLETPLVVATFGGTGTGKSTLVNALVGEEVTQTGRQRPTTTKPILILHQESSAESLGLPLDRFEIVRSNADVLRDIVIVDCPDPDTSETAGAGSNLALLRSIVPHCDVLIFAATQQKYRSARVLEELADAASGCRLLFVQTHADTDEDIRDDWKRTLDRYDVPEMFFVDSPKALDEQRTGRKPAGEFGRLLDVLRTELAASERVRVRRANVLDLLAEALDRGRDVLTQHRPAVETMKDRLAEQRNKLSADLANGLREELLSTRNLWERRLLAAVTENWGFSPFSSVLRLYNGLGGFLASMSVYRARTAAQIALIGAAEGARRLRSWQEERNAEDRIGRLDAFALDDARLRETRLVIAGYADEAGLAASLPTDSDLEELRGVAARVETQFLGNAGQQIDELIRKLAAQNSRWYVRLFYETLFGAYLAFVLWRVGKNFFWDSFLRPAMNDAAPSIELLPAEFYISAGVFFLLWSGLLVIAFARRLRRGLDRKIRELADGLTSKRLSGGLFPSLDAACRRIDEQIARLDAVTADVKAARSEFATGGRLGGPRSVAARDRGESLNRGREETVEAR
ncbi:MAG: 50S ribosome-binding GTPase [Planctomycetaceae bacterium]|nr:50S ribosome-binding GTPase [Planctomycetaceae bacterium]